MSFEWDERKNRINFAKHGIDFEDAIAIFEGPVLENLDESTNYDEVRFCAVGVLHGVEIVVIYVERGENLRIISAREANRNERENYRKAFRKPEKRENRLGATWEKNGPGN